MAIQVKCGHCGKGYRVDPKMTGKKAKCKGCGQVFVIQMIDEVSSDSLAATSSAAVSRAPASSAAPRQRVAAAVEDEGAYDLAPAPAAPTAAPAQPAAGCCPSCGIPMADSAMVCLSCGYNRGAGMRAQIVHEAPAAPVPPAPSRRRSTLNYAQSTERRGYGGVRVNDCYTNGFLNFVDQWVPTICWWLLWAFLALDVALQLFAGVLGAAGPMGGKAIGLAFAQILMLALSVALWFYVGIPITLWGMNLAGRIMKFELPEDPEKRLVCTGMLTGFVVAFFMLFAIVIMAVAAAGSSGSSSGSGAEGLIAAVGIGVVVLALFAGLLVDFLLTWFFFRLKFLESIVAYLFKLMFGFLGAIAMGLILALVSFVLGLILGVGMMATRGLS